jgi:hypothetical protein
MRKILLASVVILPLGGCIQTVDTYTPAVSPVVSAIISVAPEQVQNYAVAACGFLPTAQTVANLVAVWTGAQVPDVARQIAAEICAAVTAPKPATRRARSVTVLHGVPITGAFVR